MAIGIKQNETRSWFPKLPLLELAICASKRPAKDIAPEVCSVCWQRRDDFGIFVGNVTELFSFLPYGMALCVVTVHDVRSTEWESGGINSTEKACGDYTSGRFAWRMVNLRRLREPVPVIGRQGLFNLPPDVEAKVRAQL